MTIQPFADPFYYLNNFQHVLDWLAQRYADLLNEQEWAFIEDFSALPKISRALLVRLVMRKGEHFRASKLNYGEIGDSEAAVMPLLALGWVRDDTSLELEALFAVLQKAEIVQAFQAFIGQPKARKSELLAVLGAHFKDETRSFAQWCPQLTDRLYSLQVMTLCERLRLMFFGNLYQDWSEFVLADLGIFSYEKVEFSVESRSLRSRADVDGYLHLHSAREALEAGVETVQVLEHIQRLQTDNPWLERRRHKLLFQLGQYNERLQDLPGALAIYGGCRYPGARLRRIRVLERLGEPTRAMALASEAEARPESAEEQQHLLRILPRLRRRLGLAVQERKAPMPVTRLDLSLSHEPDESVEQRVARHLHEDHAPVHVVENTLINSLFGLLCWPAIFAPLPGAFFHPFQSGPADLHSEDFYPRRAELFAQCLEQLADLRYKQTMRHTFVSKWGLQSPFVFWNVLTQELLEQALECLPAVHLKHWFERLLLDIKANRSGMPDLIQFWPARKTYRMIEVKGPGDRLQDNQLRWLEFCHQHQMPVAVCHVQWAELLT
ncbi:VRR-NUC domain-containing protein [Pseudomonas agarici]|uniref:VRR-NUC domain-containing protein n=2 Tax=Pseudomonas agarici TaxID=46677 RepID=UPI0008D35975|nr:VRR-NUC domain-containing protein [Pseudomonas agarici]NWC08475.1 VRR-NUC domain-containing protein [Pseudomonas agarici]SEK68146.1 VRR-NUC domain-containing protein [Pseudomonas agarici]